MKNNKGFGLIEVLFAAGILSVMSLAMLKLFQSSFDSQAVLSSLMVDQDLKHAIRKSFEGVSCEKNMQSVSDDTITELKHYSSSTDTGMTLIKNGLFKEKLDIVKITIEQEPSDPIYKKLTVYYKRKGFRVLSTRDQKPCSETDLTGCYEDTCKMVYKTGGIDDTCSLLSCSTFGKNSLAGISCDEGYYLKGFDSDGNKICKTSQVNQSCSDGEYLKGFDNTGNKICRTLPSSTSSNPSSTFITGMGKRTCGIFGETPGHGGCNLPGSVRRGVTKRDCDLAGGRYIAHGTFLGQKDVLCFIHYLGRNSFNIVKP